MSRIDAIVAAQVGEGSRPRQAIQERTLQVQQAQVTSAAEPTAPVGADDLRAIAAQLKQVVESHSARKLAFEVNESGSMYLEVRDQESGEVLKQIPSEAAFRLRENLDELIGMMIDVQA